MLDALDSAEEFRSFQLLHFEETFKIDFFVLRPSEYVSESLSRAQRYELAPGRSFPFACPEDTVITKLRWFVLGNKVSDKQWNDIVQVLEILPAGGFSEFKRVNRGVPMPLGDLEAKRGKQVLIVSRDSGNGWLHITLAQRMPPDEAEKDLATYPWKSDMKDLQSRREE